MNESQTRFDLIDPVLRALGWGTAPYRIATEQNATEIAPGRVNQASAESSSPKRADYVLMRGAERIAVIEAKHTGKDVSAGVAQARYYAECFGLRLAYATNGIDAICIDRLLGTETQIKLDEFPTPDEVETLLELGKATDTPLEKACSRIPWSVAGGRMPRYYQERAVEAAIKAIGNGRSRVLLTLATGTGKTYIAFQLCHKLLEAKWHRDGIVGIGRKPRILFLADRNILADQAKEGFAFLGEAAYRLEAGMDADKVPKDRDVYFTIYQTLLGKSEDDALEDGEQVKYKVFEPDFFDMVIIDECHRGGINDESSWRAVLDYFKNAVHIGLTATPKCDVNKDTYAYFGLPAYTYSLAQGIDDGYLTSYRVKRCHSTLERYIKAVGDKISNPDAVEDGKEYDAGQIERNAFDITERDRHFVEELFSVMPPMEKTIVFCVTQQHAARIARTIREVALEKFGISAEHYCERVTAEDGAVGEHYLRLFRDTANEIPAILVTSMKLSTGVDARDVRSIVILKNVRSMVEFKQIVGRGTRRNEGKGFFTIYDFTGATDLFRDDEWDGPQTPVPSPVGGGGGERPPKPPPPCPACGCLPCICEKPTKERTTITLSTGRKIEAHWKDSVFLDGEMLDVKEFLERFCRAVKSLAPSADALKSVWRGMDSRAEFLEELKAKGFTEEKLREIQQKTDRGEYDILDISLDLVYAVEPIKRSMRAERVEIALAGMNAAQAALAKVILANYVSNGVWTLTREGYKGLLASRYGGLKSAESALGFSSPSGLEDFYLKLQDFLYAA